MEKAKDYKLNWDKIHAAQEKGFQKFFIEYWSGKVPNVEPLKFFQNNFYGVSDFNVVKKL